MTKKKLLDDIRQNPPRFYRAPGDVLRDRRFGDAERLEILRAWRDQAEEPALIDVLIVEVETRLFAIAGDHAAE